MNIPTEIVASGLGLVSGVLGLWISSLSAALKNKVEQKEHDGSMARLDKEIGELVPVTSCDLKERIAMEKFQSIDRQIEALLHDNLEDHKVLKDGVNALGNELRSVTRELAEMNKCIALLSARIPCETEHHNEDKRD